MRETRNFKITGEGEASDSEDFKTVIAKVEIPFKDEGFCSH